MIKTGKCIFLNLIIAIIIIFGMFLINVPCVYAEDGVIKSFEADYEEDDDEDPYLAEDSSSNGMWKYINNNDIFKAIRANVAKWYFLLRYIAIAVMLVALVVLAIKIAFTTLAPKRALYQRMLMDWVVGFIVVFFSHYFMILVQYINQTIIDVFKKLALDVYTGGNYSLYETVKSRAYDVKFTIGFSGMIMYMTLVYLTVKYMYIYFKRLILIVVLTISAPVASLFYAFQKLLYGKSNTLTKSLSDT